LNEQDDPSVFSIIVNFMNITVVKKQPLTGLPVDCGIFDEHRALLMLCRHDQAKVTCHQSAADAAMARDDCTGLQYGKKGRIEVWNFADEFCRARRPGAIFRQLISISDQKERSPVPIAGDPGVIRRNILQRRHCFAVTDDRTSFCSNDFPILDQLRRPREKFGTDQGLGWDHRLGCRDFVHRSAKAFAHPDDQWT